MSKDFIKESNFNEEDKQLLNNKINEYTTWRNKIASNALQQQLDKGASSVVSEYLEHNDILELSKAPENKRVASIKLSHFHKPAAYAIRD